MYLVMGLLWLFGATQVIITEPSDGLIEVVGYATIDGQVLAWICFIADQLPQPHLLFALTWNP